MSTSPVTPGGGKQLAWIARSDRLSGTAGEHVDHASLLVGVEPGR